MTDLQFALMMPLLKNTCQGDASDIDISKEFIVQSMNLGHTGTKSEKMLW